MSRTMSLLVVGTEKDLPEFEQVLESCRKYVGPIKVFSAHKAVDAVGKLQKAVQTCGTCHAALMQHPFCAPGKEDFADTLRKVLKEKHADVPVVCWGNPKKGGEQGKTYHAGLEFSGSADTEALVAILKQIQAGQIRAEYNTKPKKGLDGTRTDSFSRSPSMARSASMSRSASIPRRSSFEDQPPAKSSPPKAEPPNSVQLSDMRSTSMARTPATISSGFSESTPTLSGLSSTNAGMGMAGSPGMSSFTNMGSMAPSMNANLGMSSMGGMMAMNGMGSMMSPGMTADYSNMGGVGGAYAGMAMPAQVTAPAPAPAPAPASGTGNGELIKMLAEEVVRLRKALEQKKAREASGASQGNAMQGQFGMGMQPQLGMGMGMGMQMPQQMGMRSM